MVNLWNNPRLNQVGEYLAWTEENYVIKLRDVIT